MIRPRIEAVLRASIAPIVVSYLLGGIPSVMAEPPGIADGFAKCKIIDDDRARLDCIKKLLASPSADPAPAGGIQDRWPLVVTPPPPGGSHEAVSIMRTADTTRSDPDL